MKLVVIEKTFVRRLVAAQFPQWKDMLVWPVEPGGWDNRTFHLGEDMLVRMPSTEDYALQVEKEQRWLPKLAPLLPLPIPVPLAIGEPTQEYPWHWSIYRWLPGETAANAPIANLGDFATSLAEFLIALQHIDTTDGPLAGLHSFYRGGNLATYDTETRQALSILKGKIDVIAATEVWETALATHWDKPPVWVHGDISLGNLLVNNGQLCAVIDFGQLAIGDPACDLAIAWTFFKGESRNIFRTLLALDDNTWARGRAWTLWKALITAAGLIGSNAIEATQSWWIIEEVLTEYKGGKSP